MGSSRARHALDNAQRVSNACDATGSLYQKHLEQVTDLQAEVLERMPPQLASLHPYDEAEMVLAREYLDDPQMVFRFLRRAEFDPGRCRAALLKTLQWRLEGSIDALPQELVHSPYMDATSNGIPLFWMHSQFRDRLGRPCLYVRLQHVERLPEGLRELKAAIIACFDIMRRYLQYINHRTRRCQPVLQWVTIIDLSEAGLSNMELEMLPFLIDLLKSHYPGMVGAVYVLRFSWFHAGLWRMIRPVLPPKLLERLFFVDTPELLAHMNHAVPQTLGGTLPVAIAPDSSDVLHYFVRSAVWRQVGAHTDNEPLPLPLRARHQDFDSMYDVMSGAGSPYATVTPTSVPSTPHLRAEAGPDMPLPELPRLPSSDSSFLAWCRGFMGRSRMEPPTAPLPAPAPAPAPAPKPEPEPEPVPDMEALPMASSESVPSRAPQAHTVTRYLSWRAHKYAEMEGHVSPYNIENPYFGYPAEYVDDMTLRRPAGLPRELSVRRRKRDLVRTLSYLLVLRLLRLYRWLRRSLLIVLWGLLGPRRAWASLGRTSPGTRPSRHVRRRVLLLLGLLLYAQVSHIPVARYVVRRRVS